MDCLNCGKKFTRSDKYCVSCGQDTHTSRLQTKNIFHNFLHAFTHTDKGFFYLIPQLVTKPGIIAREYNVGRRKSYFSPFTFMILIVAINTVLVSSFDLMKANLSTINNPINEFLNKHFNIVIFIALPIMAYFTSLFFKKKHINFAECMVIGCYTAGERSIFHILIVAPLIIFFRHHYSIIITAYLTAFMLYYAWTCCQYFNDYKFWTFIKGILAFILSQVVITILISIAFFIYYART